MRAFQPNIAIPETDDGVAVSVVGPNPHFVQFIRREIEDAQGNFKTGVISKGYPLSSPQNPVWHTDALGAPNPLYDQGPGVSIQRGSYNHVATLTIFDQPSFSAAEEVYADEQWAGSTERWRAIVQVYAVCNCEVVRRIDWTLERYKGRTEFPPPKVSMPTREDLEFITRQLKADGFDPLP
jgi:hypothetical protein